MQVETNIGQNQITAATTYPISVSTKYKTITIDQFQSDLDFDFLTKYNAIQDLEEKQAEMSMYVPLGDLSTIALQNHFKFDLLDVGDGTIVYFLIFNDTIQNKPFVFAFAHKYNEE